MSFLRVLLITFTIVIASKAFCADTTGFASLEEFVTALEDMPRAKFAEKGKLTEIENIRAWHQTLLEINPEHYQKWNKKLRLLPTPGLLKNPTLWELHAPNLAKGVGFVPRDLPQPIVSIVDLYHSLRSDSIDVFQARLGVTSADDVDRWLTTLEKANPKLFKKAVAKATLIRNLGFSKQGKFHSPFEQQPPAKEIGFEPKHAPYRLAPPVQSLDDLIQAYRTKTPEDFQAILHVSSKEKVNGLLDELQKSEPELYAKVISRLRMRTRIGFKLNGVASELLPPDPKSKISKMGFTDGVDGCDVTSLLKGMIAPEIKKP